MPSFPDSVKTFTNPTEFDQGNATGVPHWTQHGDANDEIHAIEDFLLNGASPSGGAFFRTKVVSGTLEAQFKDDSGGGTPWHTVRLVTVEGQLQFWIDPAGIA